VFAAYQKFLSRLDFSEIDVFGHFFTLGFGEKSQKMAVFYKKIFCKKF
jgi:hypothetical protein